MKINLYRLSFSWKTLRLNGVRGLKYPKKYFYLNYKSVKLIQNLECVYQWFWKVFIIFLIFKNLYFSNIRKTKNASQNYYQTHLVLNIDEIKYIGFSSVK